MRATDKTGERRVEDQLIKSMAQLQRTLDQKHAENKDDITEMKDKLDKVIAGFPDADPDGHRKFHEAMILRAQTRAKFWSDLNSKLIQNGIWAVLGFICVAVAVSVRQWMHER